MTATSMMRVKVVMVGAPGVGKSSLVRRFVHSLFSEDYHSTIGVKVDRKVVTIDGSVVTMLLWDMHGEAEGLLVPDNYLRGAGATFAVFDTTNPATLEQAAQMLDRVRSVSPDTFAVLAANKADLEPNWEEVQRSIAGVPVDAIHRTSAKTGDGVEDAFSTVAAHVLAKTRG